MSKPIVDGNSEELHVDSENLFINVAVSKIDEKGKHGVYFSIRRFDNREGTPLFIIDVTPAMARAIAQALSDVSERAEQKDL